jgi:hypothetical protein
MMEGAGTTAYDGSPVGFTEDIVTGFTNGTTYPLDSFASSGDDITTAIKTNGFGGCVSNGHTYTNGQKVKVKFTYQKNSGNDLRVLFSSLVTGAGTAKSDIQNVSASGEFEHTFTMTADGVAYLQLGTGNAGHSIDAVITDVYVSPYKSANHGTISGATYAHGIGAPVAQTAVIDWNKGTNLLRYSEQLNQISGSIWLKTFATITANNTTAPDGNLSADKIEFTTTSGSIREEFTNVANALHIGSVFLKNDDIDSVRVRLAGGAPSISGRVDVDLVNGTLSVPIGDFTPTIENVGNGWYKVAVGDTGTSTIASPSFALDCLSSTGSFYAWGAQVEAADSLGAYIPNHTATPITSEVLLPQGLTTGRDITGVNLFENVRKQGALNLDGNSWAEVHDNESLDITDAITLECWINSTDKDQYHHIISKSTTTSGAYAMVSEVTTGYLGFQSALGAFVKTDYNVMDGNWNHIVVVYDEVNAKFYINGALDDTIAETTAIGTNDIKVHIGARGNGIQLFESDIAQPRIYNRALTASEVLQNYNSGKNTYK